MASASRANGSASSGRPRATSQRALRSSDSESRGLGGVRTRRRMTTTESTSGPASSTAPRSRCCRASAAIALSAPRLAAPSRAMRRASDARSSVAAESTSPSRDSTKPRLSRVRSHVRPPESDSVAATASVSWYRRLAPASSPATCRPNAAYDRLVANCARRSAGSWRAWPSIRSSSAMPPGKSPRSTSLTPNEPSASSSTRSLAGTRGVSAPTTARQIIKALSGLVVAA